MNNYICKIANVDEMNTKWDYEINNAKEDKNNWVIWKEQNIERFKESLIIPYYGILDNKIICECTAIIDSNIFQNSNQLVDNKTAYLSAFRTIKDYQGQGYFSTLFKYMINDLIKRGYERVTLGVEPNELKNKEIYFKYGFTNFIKKAIEQYPDGTKVEVEYYYKDLKE